jgi:hypothetical protein
MCRTGSGMAGSAVDDSRMPIDEATATERLDIEYLLTKCYAIVHQVIRMANEKVDLIQIWCEFISLQPDALSTTAKVAIVRLLAALLDSDYAPVHVRMFEEKTLMEILVSRFCGI